LSARTRGTSMNILFERIKIPEGKALCPGVVTHASNIVEHPELIAERILRFAKLVGRENVMAGADCGFSSQATYKTEVHPTIVWEKFRAMRQGANIATKDLWGNKQKVRRTRGQGKPKKGKRAAAR
jgi:5-methyltetrahydropteroyltriglutamate--homocysteine methyltransferase